jgi:Apea-like HEPN
VTEPINPEFESHILAAVQGVKRLVLDPDVKLGYVSKRDVPAYKANDQGWPSISRNYSGSSSEGPMDWNSLFAHKKGTGIAKFDPTDVVELEQAIDFILEDADLRSKISGFGVALEDANASRTLGALDVIRVVTTIAERSEATGQDARDVYIEHERALLATTLQADVLVPITLVRLDLDAPLHLGEEVWLERLDEPTHRARAVDIHNGVNAFLVSAATHAVVLRNRAFDNSRGPLVRRVLLDASPPFGAEINEAFQALEIATDQRLGYVQVALRPHDWAYSWLGDLPPIESTTTLSRLPRELADHGWNREPRTIGRDALAEAPRIFSSLRSTHGRGKLAARRLFQSSLRSIDEDTLLDACIGIEALLGEGRDELTHRMGLRASVALAPQMDPALAYDILKKVYGHRSKIVHGTEPKNSVINIRGDEWSAKSVAVWFLRLLLQSHLSHTPPWTPTDLDERLLGAIGEQLGSSE